jgi:hypothetical protein
MPIADLGTIQSKLIKRGFRLDDPLLGQCEACGAYGIAHYIISGKVGGRTIELCHECGKARSWRNAPGLEQRTEDPSFDLHEFLK